MGYVLEGPDGAGKSFLAQTVAAQLNMESVHFGPPEHPPLEEYLHWLVDQDTATLPGRSPHAKVIDRFHLGESVYGPLLRGTPPLTIPQLSTIEWALMIRGYSLVHVTRSLHDLVDVLEERGDDLINAEQMTKIVEAYWRVMGMSFMPKVVHDWSASLWNFPFVAWTEAGRKYVLYQTKLGSIPGTGTLEPEYVFVGERANPNLQEQSRDVPFALGQASDWLIRAIWYNLWQAKVYLTNAKKPNGDEDMIAEEISLLRDLNHQPFHVFALGQKASKVLNKHGIPHVHVVHPAYHRRFLFHDGPAGYAKLLAESLVVSTR